MNKKEESALRLRYIRALERFNKGIVSYLSKSDALSKEGFAKKVTNGLKLLQRVPPIALYKGELQDLEQHVNKIPNYLESELSIQEIKKEILYSANQLEKSKNFKKYKKPKHSKNTMDGWE